MLKRREVWLGLALWSLVSAVLIFSAWAQITTRVGWDPDDQLRLVQVRDFIGGQSWFDTDQHRLNAPYGAPMHWSRLIELPLAVVIILLTPLVGVAIAEMVTGTLVPLLLFGGIACLLAQVTTRLGGKWAGLLAAALAFMAPALLLQLRPMRIDHHGWQIFCATLAFATLFWGKWRVGAVICGVALAVWVHISLEGAPMTAAFFLFLGWRWIVDREQNRRLLWTLLSFAGFSALLFFATERSGLFAPQYCDSLSPAHLAAIAFATLALSPILQRNPPDRMFRIASAAFAGGGAMLLLLMLAPACGTGAFSNLDPLVREFWYSRVTEGLPLWQQKASVIALLVPPLLVACASLPVLAHKNRVEQRNELQAMVFFTLYSSLLSLFVFRTVSVATVYAIVPTALALIALVNRYRTEPMLARRLLLLPLLFIVAFSAYIASAWLPSNAASAADLKAKSADKDCQSHASIAALASLPPSSIVAPFDNGPMILMTSKHKVLASSHHRNRDGMRDQVTIFISEPDEAEKIIRKRDIRYIALCPGEAELGNYAKRHPDGLWGQLRAGKPPVWLQPLPDMGKGIKVWQVR